MDHIPSPLHCNPLPKVPLVDRSFRYSQYGDFKRFPLNNNIINESQAGSITDTIGLARIVSNNITDATDLATMMQSWLFFCVLARYTKGPFHRESRLVLDKWITTKDIDKLEMEFSERQILYDAWNVLDVLETNEHANQDPVPIIALSIRVLLASLEALGAFQDYYGSTSWYGCSWWRQMQIYSQYNLWLFGSLPCIKHYRTLPSTQILLRHLKDNGVCPRETVRFGQRFSYLQLCFIAQMEQPVDQRHGNCSQSVCKVETLKPHEYRQVHVCAQGRCDSKPPIKFKQLADIIKKDQIPLIRLTEDVAGIRITLEQAQSSSRYTAISHPWSDGMGNQQANNLHQCLLKKLLEDLRHMSKHKNRLLELQGINDSFSSFLEHSKPQQNDFLIWIDTLCVPAKACDRDSDEDKKEHHIIRQRAMAQIARIYASAEQVLVLDQRLMDTTVDFTRPIDAVALIACSTWGTRAWTFQEGAQSLRCIIRFKNTVVDPRKDFLITPSPLRGQQPESCWTSLPFLSMWTWEITKPLDTMDNIVFGLFKMFLNRWFVGSHSSPSEQRWHYEDMSQQLKERRFQRAWTELSARSTTSEKDLVTLPAMALEMPLHGILQPELSLEVRMRRVVLNCGVLPRSFLYSRQIMSETTPPPVISWIPRLPEGLVHSFARFDPHQLRFFIEDFSIQPLLEENRKHPRLLSPTAVHLIRHLPKMTSYVRIHSPSRNVDLLLELRDPIAFSSCPESRLGFCVWLNHQDSSTKPGTSARATIPGAIFSVKKLEQSGHSEHGNPTSVEQDSAYIRDCVPCQEAYERLKKSGGLTKHWTRQSYSRRQKTATSHCHPWARMEVEYICGVDATSLRDYPDIPSSIESRQIFVASTTVLKEYGWAKDSDLSRNRDIQLTMKIGTIHFLVQMPAALTDNEAELPESEHKVLQSIDRRFALYPDYIHQIIRLTLFFWLGLWHFFVELLFIINGLAVIPDAHHVVLWYAAYLPTIILSIGLVCDMGLHQMHLASDHVPVQLHFLKTTTRITVGDFYPIVFYYIKGFYEKLVLPCLVKRWSRQKRLSPSSYHKHSGRLSFHSTAFRAIFQRPFTLFEIISYTGLRFAALFAYKNTPRLLPCQILFCSQVVGVASSYIFVIGFHHVLRVVYAETFSRNFTKPQEISFRRSPAAWLRRWWSITNLFFILKIDRPMLHVLSRVSHQEHIYWNLDDPIYGQDAWTATDPAPLVLHAQH